MGLGRVTFRVHYGGKFDRKYNCVYLGGKIELVDENYDLGQLSFIELEKILNPFGYQEGVMIYYLQPDKSLDDGLVLLMSNDSVIGMVECLRRCKSDIPIVCLYIVSYHTSDEQVNDDEDDQGGDDTRRMKFINDPFWKSLMSDEGDAWNDGDDQPVACSITLDNDALDDGADELMANIGDDMDSDEEEVGNEGDGDEDVGHEGGGDEDVECDDGDGDEDVECDDGDGDEDMECDDEDVEESEPTAHTVPSNANQLLYDEEEDASSSNLMRSDILITPSNSDDDNEVVSNARCVPTFVEFQDVDMVDPNLHLGVSFASAKQFREAVRTYNLIRGKDVQFTKNDGDRVIGICRSKSEGCPWRVYGSFITGEKTFMIKSLNSTHSCTRKYKSSIVTSKWIADRMVHKFRTQPDYPLEALREDVKEKWNVDVSIRQLYMTRVKAKRQIEGKLREQYHRLRDYCETVRQTNRGSCLFIKVERPSLELPPTFQRLYMSLAACKNGFKAACRPVIGVDGCFLKGYYKGILLTAVGRDPNDNIYPIVMAVVEAECKDSWYWFLETLVADLGPHGTRRWTFISDRQKVIYYCMNFFFNLN
jgi:hypothetical protein